MTIKAINEYLKDRINNSWYANAEMDCGIKGHFINAKEDGNTLRITWEEDGKRHVLAVNYWEEYEPEQIYNIWMEGDGAEELPAETEQEKKARIFGFYVRDLEKLSPSGSVRYIVIEYICRFPGIDPAEMAAELMLRGYEIIFDDSSISAKANAANRAAVQKLFDSKWMGEHEAGVKKIFGEMAPAIIARYNAEPARSAM